MKIHRFFIQQELSSGQIIINDAALIHQWRNVLRFNVGDVTILFNETQEWEAHFEKIDTNQAFLVCQKLLRTQVLKKPLRVLMVAIPKGDAFEWLVEKATEIGIDDIFPIITERTYKKALNLKRLQTIAREASEQSGRLTIPRIHPIVHFKDIYGVVPKGATVAYADTAVLTDDERGAAIYKGNAPLLVCIGPEGGWSEKEVQWWHTEKAQGRVVDISLGENILKTETAAIVAAAYMCQW